MIIGEIKRYLRDNSSIRISRSIKDLAFKAIQFKEKYIKENGKEPGMDVIAKELNVKEEELFYCFDAIQTPISLQEPIYNEGSENLYIIDQIKDNNSNDENWSDNIMIREAMRKLNDKEKNIINKRFFEARTQVEVANEIGISQAQVSRIEKNAINRIKKYYNK